MIREAERAEGNYAMIVTTKLNALDPAHLRFVLERIAEHSINKIEELLPGNVSEQWPSVWIAA